MPEYVHLTKGMQKRTIQAYTRLQHNKGAFNVQPKYRETTQKSQLAQPAHGFGITRYNKKKHK